MTETENGNLPERVRALEERVARLEKRAAELARAKKPAPGAAARTYRDSFDALEYPER